jgi:hypothetical protein
MERTAAALRFHAACPDRLKPGTKSCATRCRFGRIGCRNRPARPASQRWCDRTAGGRRRLRLVLDGVRQQHHGDAASPCVAARAGSDCRRGGVGRRRAKNAATPMNQFAKRTTRRGRTNSPKGPRTRGELRNPGTVGWLSRQPGGAEGLPQSKHGHMLKALTCTFAPLAGLEPAPYGLEVRHHPSAWCRRGASSQVASDLPSAWSHPGGTVTTTGLPMGLPASRLARPTPVRHDRQLGGGTAHRILSRQPIPRITTYTTRCDLTPRPRLTAMPSAVDYAAGHA